VNAGRLCALTLLAGGCQHVTEIVVRVDSAVAVGASFDGPHGTQAQLGALSFVLDNLCFGTAIDTPEPEPRYASCVPLDGAGCLPVELGVVARGDWRDDELGVEVRGLAACPSGAETPTPYLVARARAPFVDGQVSLLSLRLDAGSVSDGTSAACPTVPIQGPLPAYEHGDGGGCP
jgi:hypothetical protein